MSQSYTMFYLLHALLFTVTVADTDSRTIDDIGFMPHNSDSISWTDLGLKTNCEDDVWHAEVNTVKEPLTKCLGLSKILFESDEFLHDDYYYPQDYYIRGINQLPSEVEHPHCRLAEKWGSCWHYLDGLKCIQPDTESIVSESGAVVNLKDANGTNIFDLSEMTSAYKASCEEIKRKEKMQLSSPESMDIDWEPPYQGGEELF